MGDLTDAATAKTRLREDLLKAGVRPGACILVHSSLSKLGHIPGGADTVIDALIAAVGEHGTVCFPALSYLFTTESNPVFDVRTTPCNIGTIPETFRKRTGVVRSVHPTHSVCALGPEAEEIVKDHFKDTTPVGPNSPFRKIFEKNGQVLFLGCTPRCNTSMHGVEELLDTRPPFLFQENPIVYSVTDYSGKTEKVTHTRHNFSGVGQRYERVAELLKEKKNGFSEGPVYKGHVYVLDAKPMWEISLENLKKNCFCFVEKLEVGEDHELVVKKEGFSYNVIPSKH